MERDVRRTKRERLQRRRRRGEKRRIGRRRKRRGVGDGERGEE
jgi:hypothetical protein